ncbi:hypothetical protein Tco_0944156, partial [Tanacetum coccineum]
ALVQKQIDEYMVHQKAILDLALQFDNTCTTKTVFGNKRFEAFRSDKRQALTATLSKTFLNKQLPLTTPANCSCLLFRLLLPLTAIAMCRQTYPKEDLRKAYEKCNHIPQESRALIDTFLKEGSDKDYELNLSMYRNASKLEKQMNAKLAWIHEKYNHRSETHIGGSSSQTHEIGDVYLTAEELHYSRCISYCSYINYI